MLFPVIKDLRDELNAFCTANKSLKEMLTHVSPILPLPQSPVSWIHVNVTYTFLMASYILNSYTYTHTHTHTHAHTHTHTHTIYIANTYIFTQTQVLSIGTTKYLHPPSFIPIHTHCPYKPNKHQHPSAVFSCVKTCDPQVLS